MEVYVCVGGREGEQWKCSGGRGGLEGRIRDEK